mmetsp:Transcript_52062/g.106147  ORF Transcript_52062/g.106147 Transcript_52062/m.106147 type:complete len:143 (-) Transcript_52062:53-481(-)
MKGCRVLIALCLCLVATNAQMWAPGSIPTSCGELEASLCPINCDVRMPPSLLRKCKRAKRICVTQGKALFKLADCKGKGIDALTESNAKCLELFSSLGEGTCLDNASNARQMARCTQRIVNQNRAAFKEAGCKVGGKGGRRG